MSDLESRIVDLELRFMKMERFAEELSRVVAEQGRTIDLLVSEGKELRTQVFASGQSIGDERPPHY
jgi:SlyX protein